MTSSHQIRPLDAATGMVSTRGLWLKQASNSVPGQSDLHVKVVEAIIAAVAELKGTDAAALLRSDGIELLHQVIGPLDLGPIRDRVLDALRNQLLKMAVAIGRRQLGWQHEFYVDDYLILRINLPYEVARKADPSGENPGIGRISTQMREIAASRRVKDPLYDPKGYHKGHPPAAWAHGPHLDSWAGHSRDGLNIWWTMCDVPAEASMVLYPELADRNLPCDRRTLYLGQDYALPAPTFVPLKPGEMLVFDPELLHGTHLNVTDQTRVAISMRLNASKPTFDPDCFYAREFWRKASDIEAGHFDRVAHLKREDNLGLPAAAVIESKLYPAGPRTAHAIIDQGVARIANETLAIGERLVAVLSDRRILIVRNGETLTAIDAACPHYGVDLTYGGQAAGKVYCPACAVAFDLRDGSSASKSLSLKFYQVRKIAGGFVIELH